MSGTQAQEKVVASVDAEAKLRGKSLLDDDAMRTRRGEVESDVQEAATKAPEKARALLLVLLFVILRGFDLLARAAAARAQAAPSSRRYNAEARDLAVRLGLVVARVRRHVDERLGDSPIAVEARNSVGVGEKTRFDSPLEMLDLAVRQVTALKDAQYQPLFEATAFMPELYLGALEPLASQLKHEIDEGIGSAQRGREAGQQLDHALNFLDVAITRTAVLLENHGLDDDAMRLRSRLQRRYASGKRGEAPVDDEPVADAPVVTQPVVTQTVVAQAPFAVPLPTQRNGHTPGTVELPVM